MTAETSLSPATTAMAHKGLNRSGIDPESGELVRLCHARQPWKIRLVIPTLPCDTKRISAPFARATVFVMYMADRVIATLRAHEEELRQAGLRSLSLFGSVARGETETDSDIDLAAEFDSAARMDLLHQLIALERRITALLGSPVDLLPEPVEKRRLQDQINRDRRRAF